MGYAVGSFCVATLQEAVDILNASYVLHPVPFLVSARADGSSIHLYANPTDYSYSGYPLPFEVAFFALPSCSVVGPFPSFSFDPATLDPSAVLGAVASGFIFAGLPLLVILASKIFIRSIRGK